MFLQSLLLLTYLDSKLACAALVQNSVGTKDVKVLNTTCDADHVRQSFGLGEAGLEMYSETHAYCGVSVICLSNNIAAKVKPFRTPRLTQQPEITVKKPVIMGPRSCKYCNIVIHVSQYFCNIFLPSLFIIPSGIHKVAQL